MGHLENHICFGLKWNQSVDSSMSHASLLGYCYSVYVCVCVCVCVCACMRVCEKTQLCL